MHRVIQQRRYLSKLATANTEDFSAQHTTYQTWMSWNCILDNLKEKLRSIVLSNYPACGSSDSSILSHSVPQYFISKKEAGWAYTVEIVMMRDLLYRTCLTSTLLAKMRAGETPMDLQVRPSGRRTYPFLQLHVKDPGIFTQSWLQTGSWSSEHSSISTQLWKRNKDHLKNIRIPIDFSHLFPL